MVILPLIFKQTKGTQGSPLIALLPLLLILLVFYLILFLPQYRRQKKHQEMIAHLSPGDEVITTGGIHGRIKKIKKNTLILKIANNVEIELEKNAIAAKK